MKMDPSLRGHGELRRHASVALQLGSRFVADVLEAGERQLDRAPLTAALIRNWPVNPSRDAVAMRFNAVLHAIARGGTHPALTALYAKQHGAFDDVIGRVMAAEDEAIAVAMRAVPQTNEVGRSAAIAAALMVAQKQLGLPFELLEIGSSCGLNLNLGHYSFDLGSTLAGAIASKVHIAPAWTGPAIPSAPIEVIAARGVDLNPLRAGDPTTRDRLLSYVWADQQERILRLEQALQLAERFPPCVDRGDAASWLSARLNADQQDDVCRVVFHSMVLQYLTANERATIEATISSAATAATRRRPLARIGFEWTPRRDEVRLYLTCWPDGETQLLATCHAYGDWIDWRGG